MNKEVMESIFSFNYDELLKEKFFNTEDEFKFKLDDEGRRMKLYLKFSKENTKGWKEFYAAYCPDSEGEQGRKHFTEEQFAKIVFFNGLQAIMKDVREAEAELAESKADEDTEDGEVTVL